MRSLLHHRHSAQPGLRRRIERLEPLPLRPATARIVLQQHTDEDGFSARECAEDHRGGRFGDIDPGWSLACRPERPGPDPLVLVAETPWWRATSRDGSDALNRLWRHSVAVCLAARRLAREAQDPDPDRVARAGLLHGLGNWVVAALDPELLAQILAQPDPTSRREFEVRELGRETTDLGRELAERWGCDALVADAAWLLSEPDRGLEDLASDARRLAVIRQALRLAEQTPWALNGPKPREFGLHDPRVKLLIAEVQSRCGGPFLDTDATPREERLTRSNARLQLKVRELTEARASRDRLVTALAGSDPTDAPETWAERAGLAWCGEPGVTTARVAWGEPGLDSPGAGGTGPGLPAEILTTAAPAGRPPTRTYSLNLHGNPYATLQVWSETDGAADPHGQAALLPAWQAWGGFVADRARLAGRLARVHRAYREQAETEEQRLRTAKLDALAEFAAGAGHELNNPLAVIVGRAQLLMVHEDDPKAVRSLRAILTQAQRAHRILRDLMYVARPPEPRPKFCQPDEIVRASLRDARPDADDREVRLDAEVLGHGVRAWADPDGLRHLADMLIRNALEATPRGGQVRVSTAGDSTALRWTVQDNGSGISDAEGGHLFDPFFCGRQAGRGLGMGLPRASRFVKQAGGEIRWHSTPGQGSSFVVRLPLAEPPLPLPTTGAPKPAAPSTSSVGRGSETLARSFPVKPE